MKNFSPILLLIISVTTIEVLVPFSSAFHFGKDGGYLFRIFTISAISSLCFYFISKKLRFFLYGFLIGFFSFLIPYITLPFILQIIDTSASYYYWPSYIESIIATLIVSIVFIIINKRLKK